MLNRGLGRCQNRFAKLRYTTWIIKKAPGLGDLEKPRETMMKLLTNAFDTVYLDNNSISPSVHPSSAGSCLITPSLQLLLWETVPWKNCICQLCFTVSYPHFLARGPSQPSYTNHGGDTAVSTSFEPRSQKLQNVNLSAAGLHKNTGQRPSSCFAFSSFKLIFPALQRLLQHPAKVQSHTISNALSPKIQPPCCFSQKY